MKQAFCFQAGADLNARDQHSGCSPLHLMAAEASHEIFRAGNRFTGCGCLGPTSSVCSKRTGTFHLSSPQRCLLSIPLANYDKDLQWIGVCSKGMFEVFVRFRFKSPRGNV